MQSLADWLDLFIFSTDSPSFLHAIELVLFKSQPLPTATLPYHHVLKSIWDYIFPRGWICTIEYNGTQTLAIRPSYVCTQALGLSVRYHCNGQAYIHSLSYQWSNTRYKYKYQIQNINTMIECKMQEKENVDITVSCGFTIRAKRTSIHQPLR